MSPALDQPGMSFRDPELGGYGSGGSTRVSNRVVGRSVDLGVARWVIRAGDGLQVVRTHAGGLLAEVMNDEAIRHVAGEGANVGVAATDVAVAVRVDVSRPEPARRLVAAVLLAVSRLVLLLTQKVTRMAPDVSNRFSLHPSVLPIRPSGDRRWASTAALTQSGGVWPLAYRLFSHRASLRLGEVV